MKAWWRTTIPALALTGAALAAWATTSDVYRTDVFIQGSVQSGITSNPILSHVQITTDDLINLGLARPLGTVIDPTEILALAKDCTNDTLRVIIYDLNSGQNLSTIANYIPTVEVEGLRKGLDVGETVGDLVIVPNGDGTNGLTGGILHLAASTEAKKNVCLGALRGAMIGNLGTVFPFTYTNFPCTNFIICAETNTSFCITNCVWDGTTNIINTVTNYNVAVSRARIATKGQRVGRLIETAE